MTSYYHADGLGSITSLTNVSGAVVNSYEYDSFGKLTTANETVSDTIRYTAREDDGETKLYYYRARYYDFSTGRFLSEDPLGFQVETNFYFYVGNQPTVRRDPLGLFPRSWHRERTYELALATFGPRCEDKAKRVAEANAAVDDFGGPLGFFAFLAFRGPGWDQPGAHFPDAAMLDELKGTALLSCSLDDLGKYLHSQQDSWAHSGWDAFAHYTHVTRPDTTAKNDPYISGLASYHTASALRKFKEKCLKCCQ